ncbi:MAG TPA: thioredoxin family protein [Bacillales bacterium]|nr:thioredoxin family protein [Bacillales bacterium]
MPGWQSFYNEHKDDHFKILSVAVDGRGAAVVKPYTEGTDFTTVVDDENRLVHRFGFKKVPNGIFLDEEGTIRMIKEGFEVSNEDHVQAVEKLIRGDVEKVEFPEDGSTSKPSDMQAELAQTKYKLGVEYARADKKDEALKELDEALALDPENFVIRKQRWYIRHPEKFSPVIDFEWQQEQLKKEKAEESQGIQFGDNGMVCGPDGCYIPGMEPKGDQQ